MAGLLDYASSIAGEAKNYASSVADEAKKNVQGLLADPKQQLMKTLNNLTAGVAASQAKTKAAWATRDPDIIAQDALDGLQTALSFAPLGITAWHGSPHKFNKFSMDKIGTGEGAQAYGHGLYLAEAPEVAQAYANKLTTVNGQAVSDQLDGRVRYLNMLKQQAADGDVNAAKNVPVIEKSIAELKNQGSLYKTDIPEEAVARMLDWDKPLSQQSKEVQAALQRAADIRAKQTGGSFGPLDMGQAGREVVPSLGESRLRQAGIPGIRYLDEGSRNTTQRYIAKHPMGGESVFNTQPELDAFIKRNPVFKAINPNLTSNYVVFDPEMIRILERNGQATGAVPWQPGEWRGLLGNN